MLEYGASRLIPLESARSAKGDPRPCDWSSLNLTQKKPPRSWSVGSFYPMKISNKIP